MENLYALYAKKLQTVTTDFVRYLYEKINWDSLIMIFTGYYYYLYRTKQFNMTPLEFAKRYYEAFGQTAPMPIAFGYSDRAASEVGSIPKYMIGRISKVREGESLTLCADNVICGGGGFYTAFRPMPSRCSSRQGVLP